MACAVDAFERELVSRIVLTRPAVEAGERLGFLPGDLAQKVDPYLRPLYDAPLRSDGLRPRHEDASRSRRSRSRRSPTCAGRTLNHAFIILDEAQNTTPEQMKMFLTRIGIGAKAVITGDVTQVDLPKGQKSGLIEARRILHDVRGIAFTEFGAETSFAIRSSRALSPPTRRTRKCRRPAKMKPSRRPQPFRAIRL